MKSQFIVSSPSTPAEFEAYFLLRWQVLRQPWGQPSGSEKDELEDKSFHLMAVDENGKMGGVCRLDIIDETSGQIRYMAVHPELQGMGLGILLMEKAEMHAREKGLKKIFLHSRASACEFYRKQGYILIEKTYLLFNEIQHYSMEKPLI